MNPKKNQALIRGFVIVMIVGLVGVYVPLLFSGSAVSDDEPETYHSVPASELPPATPPVPTSTPTSSVPTKK
jgi:hypothetical protein